jgi:acyl-CoA dehydrogenase
MNENQSFFRDTVERILVDTIDKSQTDLAESRQLPAAYFDALIENGITQMLLPESDGGIGATLGDAADILRAAGHAAAPGPLLETMLGQQLLVSGGLQAADGLLSLVFLDDVSGPDGTVWKHAAIHDVPWSEAVEKVLAVVRVGDRARLIVSEAADWTVVPRSDAAGEPRDTLTASSIDVIVKDVGKFDAWLRAAAILRGAQTLGCAEWAFQRSVEYVGERKQFGRKIGEFQAVQQMLAELAGHILASGCIVEAASEGGNATLIASARSRLGDATDAAIAISHQIHGALGFSHEYALNARTRRLMAWRDDFGSVGYWRRALGSEFAGLGQDRLWPAITDASTVHAG